MLTDWLDWRMANDGRELLLCTPIEPIGYVATVFDNYTYTTGFVDFCRSDKLFESGSQLTRSSSYEAVTAHMALAARFLGSP